MNDHELERILIALGRESRLQPSAELLHRTKRRVRESRLLPPVVFASLAVHLLLMIGVVALALLAPGLSWLWRGSILAGMSLVSGACLLAVVAAREEVGAFCARLERLFQ